jgi:hypothetical protein
MIWNTSNAICPLLSSDHDSPVHKPTPDSDLHDRRPLQIGDCQCVEFVKQIQSLIAASVVLGSINSMRTIWLLTDLDGWGFRTSVLWLSCFTLRKPFNVQDGCWRKPYNYRPSKSVASGRAKFASRREGATYFFSNLNQLPASDFPTVQAIKTSISRRSEFFYEVLADHSDWTGISQFLTRFSNQAILWGLHQNWLWNASIRWKTAHVRIKNLYQSTTANISEWWAAIDSCWKYVI